MLKAPTRLLLAVLPCGGTFGATVLHVSTRVCEGSNSGSPAVTAGLRSGVDALALDKRDLALLLCTALPATITEISLTGCQAPSSCTCMCILHLDLQDSKACQLTLAMSFEPDAIWQDICSYVTTIGESGMNGTIECVIYTCVQPALLHVLSFASVLQSSIL